MTECSKCHAKFMQELDDGPDGLPACEFCCAVSQSEPGYEQASLMNAVFRSLSRQFNLDDKILGEPKRGPGRPRKN